MFTGLKGKNVLITGGTSGIGQAIAVRFAAEGAHVAINYRKHPEDAAETDELVHQALEACVHEVAAHGVNHILVRADVSKEDEVVDMVQEVADKLGGLDILVNNASIQVAADSDELALEHFDRVLAVNLRGAFVAAQAAIRHFLAADKPGVTINVSSKTELAVRLQTSRSQVDRLLNPDNTTVTLNSLERLAHAVGKRLVVQLA